MIDTELTRGLRVLLVDDDIVDRMAVVRALAGLGAGIVVTEVDTALQAVDALRTADALRDTRFDCLLSDLHMPGHDGAWLLAEVGARGFDVPVIVLTGQGDEQTAVAMMKAGAMDYLSKATISSERLASTLQHVIRVHRAEREARRAQDRLTLALDATGLGTWDLDPLTRELTLDARARELHGVEQEGPLPFDGALPATHPADRAEVAAAMAHAMDPSSGGHYQGDHRLASGDDPVERWVRVTGQVTFANGRPARFVGTVQDVTALRLRLQFEQQLVGIVSHDLRNPISAMIMGAQILRERVTADSGLAPTIGRILSSGERATRLIRDLLDFTQATTGHGIPVYRRPADLHLVCGHCVDEIGVNHPRRRIEHVTSGSGEGSWDPDRMGQVVGNLMRNALTYSPPDSPITVRSLGEVDLEPDRVRIEVHNENLAGPIPPEVRASLFQPYRRGAGKHEPERSIGLGLFIVCQIVVAHGGSVEIHSTEQDGTTFRVELPRR